MHMNEVGFINFGKAFNSIGKTVSSVPKAIGSTQQGAATGIGKFLTGAQNLADKAIEARIAFAQTKNLWNNPLGIPNVPGSTGQRFIPQTTSVSTGGGISASSNDDMSRNEIAAIQQGLIDKGYIPGKVDGLYGPNTGGAIKTFQRDNNLPVTGAITYDLLNRLKYQAPVNPTAIPYNPSASNRSSVPQQPTGYGSGAAPYFTPYIPTQQPTQQAPAQAAMPAWAIPAAIGGVGLLLILSMGKR